jgi:hypothetical protein
MFNPTRWSRILTVPALLVAAVILLVSPSPVWTIVFFPPAAALPWLVVAAAKVTPQAIRHGLIATRAAACVTAAWGLVALTYSLIGGAVILGAALLLLQAAGTKTSEPRLAIVVLILGVLIALVAVPMMWLGVQYGILLPAGLVMCAGGASWLVESARAPVSDEVIPFAIASEALPRDATVVALAA